MIWKATNGSDTWYKIELQSTTASFKFNRIADNNTQRHIPLAYYSQRLWRNATNKRM